jgi:hypothetical protein
VSNMNDSPHTDDEMAGRHRDDLGRDLEVLLERLAESREAIVRLLAARSGDEETVTEEAWGDDETAVGEARGDVEAEYVEPRPVEPRPVEPRPVEPRPFEPIRALRSAVAAAEPSATGPVEPEASSVPVGGGEPLGPKLDSDVTPGQLPSSLRRPGPPALEVALIYRRIAENGAELLHETRPGEVSEGPAPIAGPNPTPVARAVKAPRRVSAATDGPRAARRRLLAVVLVAVGSVVLLTTIVSLLPTLVNLL